MRHSLLCILLTACSVGALADVTPLDNDELDQLVIESRSQGDEQALEDLEALQDQQRMLPSGERRDTPVMMAPPPQQPPGQQQYLDSIIDTINSLQPPPQL